MIPLEALRSREGAAYLGGAAIAAITAALLTASTLLRFLHEEDLREAFAAAGRDDGTAANLLSKLRAADPRDVDVRVLLGCIESERGEEDPERLEVADKLFAEALAIEPSRDAALIGQVATRLRMAMAGTPEGRPAAVEAAADLLQGAGDSPDVTALKAAVHILQGRPAEALKKLDAPLEGDVTLGALRAWHWNRAVAAILVGDGRALEAALPAYVLRPHQLPSEWAKPGEAGEFVGPRTNASRMLAAAYRVSLVGAPGSPEEMSARCAMARSALASRHDGGQGLLPGRFHPAGRDLGAGWNALGIAYLRLARLEDAAEAFRQAATISREPAYDFNYAEALYRQALALPPEDGKRGQTLMNASTVYEQTLAQLKKQEGREATRALAATNMAVILFLAGSPQEGAKKYVTVDDKDFADLGRRYRNLGALYDHCNQPACIAAYKKAVELGAPDGEQIQRRLAVWEARRGGRR